MECLVMPVSVLMRRCSGKYQGGYRPLGDGDIVENDGLVTVVVGRESEKREFLVDPFVLEESPFRVLIETGMKKGNVKERRKALAMEYGSNTKRVIFVDVDAILFEHMLWLMYNDCSSFFNLNVKEIIDFYALDF